MFQLTPEEAASLRSQSVTLKMGRGEHRKYSPMAFTEQGVAMLSSVLCSKKAVLVNVEAIRELMAPPSPASNRSIGFGPWSSRKG